MICERISVLHYTYMVCLVPFYVKRSLYAALTAIGSKIFPSRDLFKSASAKISLHHWKQMTIVGLQIVAVREHSLVFYSEKFAPCQLVF